MKPLIYHGEIISSGRQRLFSEPRFNTFATTAAIIGAGTALTSIGLSASGALNPTQPNLGSSSASISNAQAAMLPIQRQLEALAATGGSGMIDMPEHYQTQQFLRVPASSSYGAGDAMASFGSFGMSDLFGGQSWKLIPYNPADWEGKELPGKIVSKQVKIPAGPQKVDFTGMGQADIQKSIADKMAQVGLSLSKKYDPQFIDEALKEQELANPEGASARKKEYELIQKQINDDSGQPVADTLNKQIGDRVNAGKGLDEFDQGVLNDSIAKASEARGGNLAPNADFADPLTTGEAGNARQMQGIQQGAGWLSSGETPEDVAYRREQQNLANLANFSGGKTPESEFTSLSGAQNGPSPMSAGQPLPTSQMNSTIAGAGAGATSFNQLSGQANPWIQGLGTVINAGNSVANTLQQR